MIKLTLEFGRWKLGRFKPDYPPSRTKNFRLNSWKPVKSFLRDLRIHVSGPIGSFSESGPSTISCSVDEFVEVYEDSNPRLENIDEQIRFTVSIDDLIVAQLNKIVGHGLETQIWWDRQVRRYIPTNWKRFVEWHKRWSRNPRLVQGEVVNLPYLPSPHYPGFRSNFRTL